MKNSKKRIFDLFIVLHDLSAEGCPILALNLIDEFKKKKLKILLLTLKETNVDLIRQFKKREINRNYMQFFKTSRRYTQFVILNFVKFHQVPMDFAGISRNFRDFLEVMQSLPSSSLEICEIS